MDNFEKLEQYCQDNSIEIIEEEFSDRIKGLYCDGTIALNCNLPNSAEKACVLAEELGHYHTSYGNIIAQSDIINRKQEQLARAWAYNKMIDLYGLILCFQRGCSSTYEAAEYLGVTEGFFKEAIRYYKQHYGSSTQIDNYMIFFEPLGVLELYKKNLFK